MLFNLITAGRPEPTVTWMNGTQLLESGSGVSMGRHVTVNRLEVPNITRSTLNNTYRCQASNTKLVPPVERSIRIDMLRKFNSNPTNIKLKGKHVNEREMHNYLAVEANINTKSNNSIKLITVRPTLVNLTNKLKVFSSGNSYNLTCVVDGSVPDTEIKWTQNNHPFKRGIVSKSDFSSIFSKRYENSFPLFSSIL